MTALRRHGADRAKLHRNGAQIGETTEGESDDDLGVGAQIRLDIGKVQIGDKLVHDHLLTNQGSCRHHLAGGHANQPGHRGKQIAKQLLQGEIGPAEPLADRGETCVDHGDDADKGEQDSTDGHSDFHTAHGAARQRIDGVAVVALVEGDLGLIAHLLLLRHQQFGHQQATRRRHKGGGNQVFKIHTQTGVTAQHRARHRGHATGHHRKELGAGHTGEEGANKQRRLTLREEDIAGGHQGFGAAGAEQTVNGAAQYPDHPLHDAEVVEYGDQRADKDHQRQHPHGEDKAVAGEIAKHKADAAVGKAEQGGDAIAHGTEHDLSGGEIEHQGSKTGLQGERTQHGSPADGSAVFTRQPGDKHQGQHTDQTQ